MSKNKVFAQIQAIESIIGRIRADATTATSVSENQVEILEAAAIQLGMTYQWFLKNDAALAKAKVTLPKESYNLPESIGSVSSIDRIWEGGEIAGRPVPQKVRGVSID